MRVCHGICTKVSLGKGKQAVDYITGEKLCMNCEAVYSHNYGLYCSCCGLKLRTTPIKTKIKKEDYGEILRRRSLKKSEIESRRCQRCGTGYTSKTQRGTPIWRRESAFDMKRTGWLCQNCAVAMFYIRRKSPQERIKYLSHIAQLIIDMKYTLELFQTQEKTQTEVDIHSLGALL